MLDLGVRAGESTITHEFSATPWLLGVRPLGARWSLRGGFSAASQVPDFDQATGSFSRPGVLDETSRDGDLGVEFRPVPSVRLQVTAYDRHEDHGLRLEDSETRLSGTTVIFDAALAPFWLNTLTGASRGFEVVVQRRAEVGLSGWVGYAYGRTRYTDGLTRETYWGDFDQRHTLNAYGEERLTAKTSVSVKLRIGSNTPLPGYFQGDVTGVLSIGAARNTVRLPVYARLDLRANHTFVFTRRRLTLFVEIVNVTDRTNLIPSLGEVLSNGRAKFFTISQFPVLPSVGLVVEW
jgi:hypothetical protein